MGGRGGSPNSGQPAPAAADLSTEERDFRQWLASPTFAHADMVNDPDVPNKVILNLPDRGAYVDRGVKGKPVVRDVTTDEVLFRGSSDPDLYRQISKFYGVRVEYTNERTNATTMHGVKGNPRTSPAAKKYGIS